MKDSVLALVPTLVKRIEARVIYNKKEPYELVFREVMDIEEAALRARLELLPEDESDFEEAVTNGYRQNSMSRARVFSRGGAQLKIVGKIPCRRDGLSGRDRASGEKDDIAS